jgi:hypothetical protein
MKARQLVVQVLVLVAVLVAGNGAVAFKSRNFVPRQKLRSIEASPPADVVFLGNSLMEAGADCRAFESAWPGPRALNLGLGASSAAEHALLWKAAGRHAGAEVVYGFMADQLTAPVPGGWEELTGNRAMAYYADLEGAIALYAPDSPWQAWQMRLVSKVPLLVERTAIWARVERVRRRLGRVGLPPEETNQFGRAADFAAFEPPDPPAYDRACRQAAADRVPLCEPVRALFRLARARGSKVLVVEMPMTSSYRRRFCDTTGWSLYRQHLQSLARQEGGDFLSAVDWAADDLFSDGLHLGRAGAAAFSRRLALTMKARQDGKVARRQGGGR